MAGLRLSPDHGGTAAARLRYQPQARTAAYARGQFAVRAATLIRRYDRFAACACGVSELARSFTPTGVNQLWVADITYIRLRTEFVYMAVLLDAFSRKVIGWTLESELAVQALRMALLERRPPAGLVHHSDRGIQYAGHVYTDLLRQHDVRISMSRKGNPYDNAACESFMKTLKYEEVYRNDYRDMDDAAQCLAEFVNRVYNKARLHSALGYVPPDEFETRAGDAA